jgi:hypothetical protein
MRPTTKEQEAQIERLERLGREAEHQVVSAMPSGYYFEQARLLRNRLRSAPARSAQERTD